MRDDDTGRGIRNEEFREVFDARSVKVVCRLVQEKQVWVLDERRGEQEARLLAAREALYDSVMHFLMMLQIHHLEYVINTRVDVIHRLRKTFLKEFADRECHLVARDHLRRRRYPHAARHVYLAGFGLELASHQREECGFPRAVLTHHCHFHSATNGKIHLIEDRFVVPIFKRNFLKANDALFSTHQPTLSYFPNKWKRLVENLLIFDTIFTRWITNEKIV